MLACILIMCVPFAAQESAAHPVENIRFNQHQIEGWLGISGPEPAIAETGALAQEASFDDEDSILRAVLAAMPDSAVVYPSERYYYYEFDLGHRRIGGNIRFTDAEDGVVHIGYFDRDDQRALRHKSFTSAEGLSCETVGDGVFRVSFDGVTRDVRLALEPLAAGSLLANEREEWVTGVLDESGWILALIWNKDQDGFFFVSAAGSDHPEEVVDVIGSGGRLLVGRRSRMVFWIDESDRMVLVGVRSRAVSDNSWYDGPFDQVPPRLPIGEKIEAAYPYVTFRGGIDDHGNFLELENQRVAISPYQAYRTIDELLVLIQGVIASSGEDAVPDVLTYERKRQLSRVTPAPEGLDMGTALGGAHRDHRVWMSQGWPANHHSLASGLWPHDHEQTNSRVVSPNSVPATWDAGDPD